MTHDCSILTEELQNIYELLVDRLDPAFHDLCYWSRPLNDNLQCGHVSNCIEFGSLRFVTSTRSRTLRCSKFGDLLCATS